MGLKYTQINSQEPRESSDVRFIALRCTVFELSASENSAEFPAESGCKAKDLTRYKVDTACCVLPFIIHPCDPTVVICYLIWPCDIAVRVTYFISHSYSLTYNLRIFQFGCIIGLNTKLPSCDDRIHRTSLGFPAGALKALVCSRHQL